MCIDLLKMKKENNLSGQKMVIYMLLLWLTDHIPIENCLNVKLNCCADK